MLKMEREIKHISYSSYNNFYNMPNTTYLTRCIKENRMPKTPQGLGAALGSAFDFRAKKFLIDNLYPEKAEYLPELKKGITTNVKDSFRTSKRIWDGYRDIAMNLEAWNDVEINKTFMFRGIPIMTKLDASVKPEDAIRPIPFDWKVFSYFASGSPVPGYVELYDNTVGRLPRHEQWYEGIELRDIKLEWSEQMAFYLWALGWSKDKWEDGRARMHQITFTKKRVMRISIYDGIIPAKQQENIFKRVEILWDEIKSGKFINRLYSRKHKNMVFIGARKEKWFMPKKKS